MNRTKNSPDEAPQPQERNVPKEKRFRWTKRIVLLLLILVVGAVGLWFWWNAQADRQIQAEIARYRAAGQPFDPGDFEPPPIDDKDNAALVLKEAVSVMKLDTAQNELISDAGPQVISENLDALREIVEENTEVFKLVRKARSMSGVDWGIRLRSSLLTTKLPDYSSQRDLVRLLTTAARYHHRCANDASAVQLLRDALSASSRMGKAPFLISHLVRIATDSLVYRATEPIAPDLSVSPGSTERSPSGAVSQEQVRELIAELFADEGLMRDFQMAFYSERSGFLDASRDLLHGGSTAAEFQMPLWWHAGMQTLKPLVKKDLVKMLRILTKLAEAAAQSSYSVLRTKLPQGSGQLSKLQAVWRPFSTILAPSFDRLCVLHFRALAMRRMAAVALAIRLYELDHGKRPEQLTELVPKYLPAVPQDPFAADGRPIGYLPHAPHPFLYSVNDNEIDQGGKYAETPHHRPTPDKYPSHGGYDLPFFLNGDRPTAQYIPPRPGGTFWFPTTQPSPASQPSGLDQSQHRGE
jgi:hypothetical protein